MTSVARWMWWTLGPAIVLGLTIVASCSSGDADIDAALRVVAVFLGLYLLAVTRFYQGLAHGLGRALLAAAGHTCYLRLQSTKSIIFAGEILGAFSLLPALVVPAGAALLLELGLGQGGAQQARIDGACVLAGVLFVGGVAFLIAFALSARSHIRTLATMQRLLRRRRIAPGRAARDLRGQQRAGRALGASALGVAVVLLGCAAVKAALVVVAPIAQPAEMLVFMSVMGPSVLLLAGLCLALAAWSVEQGRALEGCVHWALARVSSGGPDDATPAALGHSLDRLKGAWTILDILIGTTVLAGLVALALGGSGLPDGVRLPLLGAGLLLAVATMILVRLLGQVSHNLVHLHQTLLVEACRLDTEAQGSDGSSRSNQRRQGVGSSP